MATGVGHGRIFLA